MCITKCCLSTQNCSEIRSQIKQIMNKERKDNKFKKGRKITKIIRLKTSNIFRPVSYQNKIT